VKELRTMIFLLEGDECDAPPLQLLIIVDLSEQRLLNELILIESLKR